MRKHMRLFTLFLMAVFALILGAAAPEAWAKKKVIPFAITKIFIEYNSTANDAGFHIFLDAEDWKEVEIVNLDGGARSSRSRAKGASGISA